MPLPADIELLTLQAECSFDARGRLAGTYGITIACTATHHVVWIGDEVPEPVTAELISAFDRTAPARNPAEPPAALEHCRQILELGRSSLRCKAGPSYVFTEAAQLGLDAHVERSDASTTLALRGANPGNWHPVEWNELLDGQLGPWAIACEADRVVSICHTARVATERAAECGVWTHPDFRGRGYAAAVTSAWADILRPSGRHLFYSTDAENLSSQRVALRLNLRLIGWTWRLEPEREHDDAALHPLSALRRHRSSER